MKRIILVMTFLSLCGLDMKSQNITFKFSDGITESAFKTQMEKNISALLTEFNTAYSQDRCLLFDQINILDKTKKRLEVLWDSIASFTCDFDENVTSCLNCVTGFEVREIYVTLHPRKPAEYSGNVNRELCVGFNKDGIITSAHMALEDNASGKAIMSKGFEVEDLAKRLEILKFVEDFRSYYDEKDTVALEQIFSDDALIITGTVVKRGDTKSGLRPEIKYNKQDKRSYLANLRKIFARNRYIRVKFDDIEIKRHPGRDDFYGVSLKQNWKAMNANQGIRYEDDGYVFLLWEFPKGKNPLIHVRTWQPEKDEYGNLIVDPEDKFSISDFIIPEKKK